MLLIDFWPILASSICSHNGRSEERRVGKECRSRRSTYHYQAEDGIRDLYVTGVQTCALPISLPRLAHRNGCPVPAVQRFYLVVVIGVQWLTGFEHKEVGIIHDVIDRFLANLG